MAFNDVRISAPSRGLNPNITFDRSARPKNAAQKNNFTKDNAQVAPVNDINMVADLPADWFLEELDFDKVVKKNPVDAADEQIRA